MTAQGLFPAACKAELILLNLCRGYSHDPQRICSSHTASSACGSLFMHSSAIIGIKTAQAEAYAT
jgi:hypothetical protein